MTGILIKKEKTHRDSEEGYVNMEAEIFMMWLQAKDPKDCQGPPEARKGQPRLLPQQLQRSIARQLPELRENELLLLTVTQCVALCDSSPRKLIQGIIAFSSCGERDRIRGKIILVTFFLVSCHPFHWPDIYGNRSRQQRFKSMAFETDIGGILIPLLATLWDVGTLHLGTVPAVKSR